MHSRTGRSIVGQNFDEAALSIYLLVHSSYWIGAYCFFGILHMALGLMNANDPDTWGSAYICIGLECIIILVYAMDMWLVSRLTSTVGNEMTAGSTETSQSRDDPVQGGS